MNEGELLEALQEHYGEKADVSLAVFNVSLTAAMLAVNSTDVLIGMHGAGAGPLCSIQENDLMSIDTGYLYEKLSTGCHASRTALLSAQPQW